MVPRYKPLFEFRACFLPKYEREDIIDKINEKEPNS
jgi:hypothetical protein